jgi:hypothetical protein
MHVENTETKMTKNLGSRSPPKNNKIIISLLLLIRTAVLLLRVLLY